MKRKLFFITLLMLFCTTMFGQQHWTMSELEMSFYQTKMSYYTFATIDGVDVDNNDIQIAAFHGNELRGCAFPSYNGHVGKYIFVIDIYGTTPGDQIYFKLYKPDGNGGGVEYGSDFTINYNYEYVPTQIPTIDFYNKHWNYEYVATEYMQYPCVIKIDGVLQERTNLELAAFCGEELRGVARPQKENITEGLDIYMASLKIEGTNNETISFKLYDPTIPGELSTDKTILFDLEYGNQNVVEIDFRNEAVAQITNTTGTHYFASLEAAVEAAQNGETILLLQNVTLTETLTIEKSITIDGNGFEILPADDSKTYDSAIMVGNSGWGDDHGEVITLNNIKFNNWKSYYGVVRAQGVTLNMEGCEFNENDVSNAAYGVLSLNFTDAIVKNSNFKQNTDRAIDINYNGDDSNAVVTIDGCIFEENASEGAGIVVRNDGDKLVVKNSKFLNNTVTTNGNAAVLYAGWATNDEITGCYFSGNTVTTSHATTKRFASAIFCDGCTVTGNAFENNTATRNGETITTTVAVGAYYGAANISENYWGKENPVAGTDYTVEYPNKDVAFNSYYKSYSDTEGLTDLVELNNVAKVGKYYYTSLAEAFAAVQNGETVKLLTDLTLDSETYTIADGKSVTLDMNGKEITVTDNKTINYELFYIYGGLTVIGDGTIELTATNDRDWNAMSAIFHNRGGVLTINNGTFKHLGGTDMAYVVDNSGNYYGDATTNINNGTLASTYIAIRNRMEQNTHGASGKAILNVYGGTINGERRAIWAQAASTSEIAPATGEINISGGNIGLIETDRSTGAVSMTTISGGTVTEFKGEVNELTVTTGGTLNDVTIMDASGNEIDYAVNNDGLYVAAVAKIGDKGYVSIQAAVNEAQDGNTVIVKEGKYNVFCPADSDDNYTDRAHNLFVGKSITIKGEEGKEVVIYSYQETYTDTFDARITLLISGSDGVVIDNLTILPCYYPATITTDLSTVTGSEINALVGADNLKYYYNQIIDAMRSYNGSGQVSKNYIANITVKNCTIGDEAIPAENWGSAIYYPGAVGNATNFAGLTGGYTIENNVLFGGICICEGAAKDATTETCIIKDNTIHGGLFLNGKRPTGWNYVSLTVFPTVTGNTFTQAAGNTDGHAWFIGSRDGDEAAVIPTGTLEAYLANNTFTVASDKKAKVVVGNYAYSAEATEYYGLVSSEFIVDGEGTENNPYIITDLHELEAFRDAVNAGNDFSGKVFKLKSNIDLNPTRAINIWEPIGTQANPFEGTFDGGDHTISDLVVEGENYLGLFGKTNGATIKNVKINNVTINGVSYLGAIVGMGYTGTIDNCHVTGDVKIAGNYMVGGINGQGYATVNNSSVVANDNSFVKAIHDLSNNEGDNVGGIVGHCGETNTLTANTVKNITISGTRKVGGIVGIANQGTKVENCVVEDVTIETSATEAYANDNITTMSIGALIGQYQNNGSAGTVKDCMVKNVEFNNVNNVNVSVGPITGGSRGGTNGMLAPTGVTASGNNIFMSTITGSNNLYLMNPVAKIGTTEYYTLFDAVKAAQGETTTITLISNTSEEFAINNTATAITLDLNGKELTGAITPSEANLTIEKGTIVNKNSSVSAIEINAGSLTLNEDVTIESARHAVRIDGTVTATINGGNYKVKAYDSGKTQHAVNVSGTATVTILGGTFVGPKGTTADSGSAVNVQSGSTVTIEGGDFSGGKNVTISSDGNLTITGGTYDQDVTDYCADGYVCQMNADNKYEVFFAVASITNANGTLYYASLQAAVNAAGQNETTIVMIADAEVSQTVRVEAGQKITLDLNGKTIDGTEKVRIALMSYGDLTIKDSTEEKNGMIKAGIGTAGNTVNICKGTFTLESGNIYSKNNAILIDEQTATVNINGGTITAEPTTNNSAAFYISSTSDTEVNITAGTMKGFNGILLWNNTKINITGGSVIAEGDLAIQGNGSKDNTEINISGENTIITGKDAAIYHPQGGKLNISGGTITGETGIVVKGGVVTISGGTINGTGAYAAYEPVSSGYNGTGDALYVEHYDNSTDSGNYGTPVVTVTGGTFNSTNAHPIASYANPYNASNGVEALAKFIKGGAFNKEVEESLLAVGYALTENNGMYEVSFADYIVLPSFMNENNYEDYFGTNTVTDGTNYYATLQAAVEAVVGQADAILYCKPGADVGSLQHAPVTNTLTVHGNDAYVSGGAERDFDLGNTDPSYGQDITSDMTLTVRYLDGCGAWGAKATEHTVNLVFENCHNMGKVFVTGTTGTLNITMNNCAFEGVISEALYSNADGTIALTNVAFSNLNKAVNLNHKAAGTQTVTLENCTFTNCGNDVAADQIPVRVLSSVEGGSSVLTVNACTFTGTPAGGADILLDYGIGLTEATITETNAKVVIERKNNEPEVHNVVDTQEYSFNNLPFVAEVDVTQFTSLQAAINAADGKTVVVLENITLTETVTVAEGKTVTLDLNGKNLTGGANVNLVIDGELIIEDNVGNAVSTFRNHYVSEGGKLTLKSGILQNIETNTGGYGIFIENGGESIIEGGTVQAVNESNYAICVNGTLTIVDGNIVGKHGVIAVENQNAIVTIKDGEYTLNAITNNSDHIVYVYAGMVNIEGGYFTFNNFIENEGDSMIDADKENVSITGGTYTHDVNHYCHEYYDAIQGADDLWRVEQVLFAQTTALHQGWNWFSSYVNLSTPDGLEKLQTALGGNGVIIKSNINNEFVTYEELPNGEYGWVGNEFSIYNNKMYMIETSKAHEMTVTGGVVDGTGIMFILTPGWNWIGYPIDKVQNIDVALSGLQDKAQANDMIKHRNDFAYFDASTKKWVGTLTQLEPGKGYKYKSNNSSMFYYTKSDAKETVVDNAIIDENYWKVESSGYANNMTITAMLSIDGEIVNDNYEIAAFANGECRGSARPIYVESKNAYMLFMTVFGDDVEELTFKYYDIDADTEYELSNVMNYSNDAIVGTIDNPYIFSMNILGIGENLIDNINIYPNPTTTDREINLQAICDKVEVFNALGVKVAEYHNVDTLDAFETAGIYVIRITNDNAVKHCRLVVK